MKYLTLSSVLASAVLFSCSVFALPWNKEGYVQAACQKNETQAYTCCLYDSMEDNQTISQWVSNQQLAAAKKTCQNGGVNPCNCLGVGIHNGMTYTYEGSKKCLPNTPMFVSKGEVTTQNSVKSLCQAQTGSDQVIYQG